MKKITHVLKSKLTQTLFLGLFFLTGLSLQAQWQYVGNPDFSLGYAMYLSMAIDATGNPFVAYRDLGNSGKATVMKFDGTNWVYVGIPGFSPGDVEYISLALAANGNPVVTYRDLGNSGKATVMKFDGANWVYVGTPGFSLGDALYNSLALDANGNPYVAYRDDGNSSKATVMKFDGANWVYVGTQWISVGATHYTSLAIDPNGNPVVAFTDVINSMKVTVRRFDGANWVNVGIPGFSADWAFSTSLALDVNGNPMVAYQDLGNNNGATVMKFDGANWVNVGIPGFSADAYYTVLALDQNGSPLVAFSDHAYTPSSPSVTVMKFDGANWGYIGSPGFSTRSATLISMALDASGNPMVAWSNHDNSGKANVMKWDSGNTLSISGTKYNDLNGNGVWDNGEPGLPNWGISLTGSATVTTTTTGSNGDYSFLNLVPGSYTVSEVLQSGWHQTMPASPGTYSVTTTIGQSVDNLDFGNFQCVDPPGNMVAWWPLDESSGSIANDLIGFNNIGNYVGNPIYSTGKVAGCLWFNSYINQFLVPEYLDVANHSDLNFGTDDFSIDAWIQPTDFQALNYDKYMIVDKMTTGTASQGYSFYVHYINGAGDGHLALELADGTTSTVYYSMLTSFIPSGTWYHVAVTVDRDVTAGITFYVDGVAMGTADPTNCMGNLTNVSDLRIACASGNLVNLFYGKLDEIELFNRKLEGYEISDIFTSDTNGKCKPHICGFKFNDLNQDGVFTNGEPKLAGWSIQLSGSTSASTTTDANGNYWFDNLVPGSYIVSEIQQTNWTQTFPSTPGTHSVAVTMGQFVSDINFGNYYESATCTPAVSISASPNPVCDGNNVTFTATPTNGGTSPVYQWKVNSSNVGANTPTYNYTPVNGDVVECELTSNASCATTPTAASNVITMLVNPLPTAAISGNATVCQSDPSPIITLTGANGTPPYTIFYSINGGGILFAQTTSGNTVTITQTTANTGTFVYLLSDLYDAYGCSQIASGTVTITVSPCSCPNPCPGIPTVSYGGQTYNTVQIGTQCWFHENLNIGTMISGGQVQTDNSSIEKWCYDDDNTNCTIYGGLYQWAEVIQYLNGATNITSWGTPPTGNVQGICPPGWHIPTEVEFLTLETFLGGSSVAGGKMKETGFTRWISPNSGATNSSCFTALGAGDSRFANGTYQALQAMTSFWTATELAGNPALGAQRIYLTYDAQSTWWISTSKIAGFSVRCLKDAPTPTPVNQVLQDIVVSNGQSICYDATQTITVAGNNTTFIVENGSSVILVAGQKISYQPGTTVQSGGYMHGYIAPGGPFCGVQAPSLPSVATTKDEIPGSIVQSSFKIYPNPTTGNFCLEFDAGFPIEKVTVTVYGMRGEKVLTEEITGERKHDFSLGNRPSGIYLIHLQFGNKSETKKIIKQ